MGFLDSYGGGKRKMKIKKFEKIQVLQKVLPFGFLVTLQSKEKATKVKKKRKRYTTDTTKNDTV